MKKCAITFRGFLFKKLRFQHFILVGKIQFSSFLQKQFSSTFYLVVLPAYDHSVPRPKRESYFQNISQLTLEQNIFKLTRAHHVLSPLKLGSFTNIHVLGRKKIENFKTGTTDLKYIICLKQRFKSNPNQIRHSFPNQTCRFIKHSSFGLH